MNKPSLRLIGGKDRLPSESRWIAALRHPLVTPADIDGHREITPTLRQWLDETLDPRQYVFMHHPTYIPGLTIVDAGTILFHDADAAFAFRMRWC